jgi:NAD(P)-dependent dehydrogenase (short-subunit alcohol dehydrogenase family)
VTSAIVIGAGPGIGTSVARRFAREGLAVTVLARFRATVDAALERVAEAGTGGTGVTGATRHPALGLTADVTDEAALNAALDEAVDRHGVPDALVYNAAHVQSDAFGALDAPALLDALAVNVVGAMTAIAHLGPAMARAGHGTILLTGGMPEPLPESTSLSVSKAALRGLTVLLAREYGPAGVHVATVTVAGAVAPYGPLDPDEIAGVYWRVHKQPRGAWEHEVVFRDAGQRTV